MGETAEISKELVHSLGITDEEFETIQTHLGRDPNFTELSIFSVMWSEHCSYKSSKLHLKKFPTQGPCVVQGPGENAGVVDIGDGLVAVFKMESHNHPSFIEPYQGAATGVGGILRDVFTMGAEPVALLNSLRFGSVDHPKTAYLVSGVVSGIGGYGNCFGCPTIGGEIYFHPSYNLNPLVNAFCLGIAPKEKIFYGRAKGEGNPVMYVGAKTGRDGIHGATMASQEFDDKAESKKPTVQVGDPFTEKLLLEACLELMRQDIIMGIQDMGAAGLTSSSVEMASRAGSGIELDLSKVPARETGMKPFEFLLSESQERMLLVAKKGREKEVEAIFDKWDLECAVIGRVTSDGRFRVYMSQDVVANIPVKALTEAAPLYHRPSRAPQKKSNAPQTNLGLPKPLGDILTQLIGSPSLSSRQWVFRQYDQQVKNNSVILPGGDAALIRVRGTLKGLAISVDCNSRYCQLDPYMGAQMALAESARNVSCVGARPLAITDCLNFGNPQNPEVMWQFEEAISGLSEACRFFNIPVVSGNVSLYNETNGKSIYPTPTIGMVGLLEDIHLHMTHFFKREGDLIVLLGENLKSPHEGSLSGSEFLAQIFQKEDGSPLVGRLPHLDLDLEQRVQETLRILIKKRLIESAHDCCEGGLSVAIAESLFEKEIGALIEYRKMIPEEVLLFGESPSRIVVSLKPSSLEAMMSICSEHKVPFEVIGKTVADRYQFNDFFDLSVADLKQTWSEGFEKHLNRT